MKSDILGFFVGSTAVVVPQVAVISCNTGIESTYPVYQHSLMHLNFCFTGTHIELPHQAVSQLLHGVAEVKSKIS